MQSKYRFISVGIFLALWVIILLCTLFYTQILSHHYYRSLANNQYTTEKVSHSVRGSIFDRHGSLLAGNHDAITAFITPRSTNNMQELTLFLKKYFKHAYDRLDACKKSCFMYIARNLSPTQIACIKKYNSSDIYLLKEPARFYPVEAVRNIIGSTGIDNEGLFGIEKIYNTLLGGQPACTRIQRDCHRSNYFNKDVLAMGYRGSDITLTIDNDVQYKAFELVHAAVEQCNAVEGAAIIADPFTGDIIAMVQFPTCDVSCDNFDFHKTRNICVSDAYECGSIIKPFCALAALDAGIIDKHTPIDCHNTIKGYIYGRPLSTVTPLGVVTLQEVIAQSNNFGMVQLGHQLGKRLWDYYTACGFGSKTGIDVLSEQPGYITPPHLWSGVTAHSLSFGYEIRVTLLQLARAFCLFPRNGYLPTMRLVIDTAQQPNNILSKKTTTQPEQKTVLQKPVFNKKSIDTMRDILQHTVEEGSGKRAAINGYQVIGKTGTAEIATMHGYDKSRLIVWFGGVVQKGQYARVITIFIKEPKGKNAFGSTIAAPLFRNIAHYLIAHDRVITG